jgi:hypothetical protein
VIGRALEVQTATPGFAAQVYVANHVELSIPYGSATPLAARGWQGPVGQSPFVHDRERIQLSPGGQKFRYYLLWIITLPPSRESAAITDLTLFK